MREAIILIKNHLNSIKELHKNVNPSDIFMEGMYYGGEGELENVIGILEKAEESIINDMAKENG